MSGDEKAWREAEVQRLAAQFRAEVLKNRSINPEHLDAQVFDGATAVQNNFAEGNFNSLTDLLGQLTK
jgi:F0F1-type ATP synthase membrane subunit b/b'